MKQILEIRADRENMDGAVSMALSKLGLLDCEGDLKYRGDPNASLTEEVFRILQIERHANARQPTDPVKATVRRDRIYDSDDLERAQLLEMRPEAGTWQFGADARDEAGQIILVHDEINPSVDLGFTALNWHVVPDRVKRLLEQSSLCNVVFHPTTAYLSHDGPAVPWSEVGPPYWELASDVVLPPVSATMDVRNQKTEPVARGDPATTTYRYEKDYIWAELHYCHDDIQKMPHFDLAHTFEPFGGGYIDDFPHRPLVASPRCYRFCRDHKLNIAWMPVRIDEC